MGSGDDNLKTSTSERMASMMTAQKYAKELQAQGKAQSELGQQNTVPATQARQIIGLARDAAQGRREGSRPLRRPERGDADEAAVVPLRAVGADGADRGRDRAQLPGTTHGLLLAIQLTTRSRRLPPANW